jgi:hypothetical protein
VSSDGIFFMRTQMADETFVYRGKRYRVSREDDGIVWAAPSDGGAVQPFRFEYTGKRRRVHSMARKLKGRQTRRRRFLSSTGLTKMLLDRAMLFGDLRRLMATNLSSPQTDQVYVKGVLSAYLELSGLAHSLQHSQWVPSLLQIDLSEHKIQKPVIPSVNEPRKHLIYSVPVFPSLDPCNIHTVCQQHLARAFATASADRSPLYRSVIEDRWTDSFHRGVLDVVCLLTVN